jgi:hypothetical protein
MSKESPTLADALIREWLKPTYRRLEREPGWLARTIASARKFVLDEKMSAFLGDLAYASLTTCDNPERATLLTDAMRQAARLPHPITFIEYDMEAKKRRVRSEYGSDPRFKMWDPHAVGPKRCGWLLMQHPQLSTAFMAIECASESYGNNDTELLPIAQPCAVAYAWRVDDGPPPWPEMSWKWGIPAQTVDGHPMSLAGWLTGIPIYRSESVRLVYPPTIKSSFVDFYHDKSQFNTLNELASDARYLWALLATINDLPTRVTEVRPDRGYVARGSYRRFSEHKIITLTVPTRSYKRLAMRAIAVARRRRHAVRGHWRLDFRHRLSPLCEHEFSTDDNVMACARCGGQRLWIEEHERGDATLGFVLHDYKVERGDAA